MRLGIDKLSLTSHLGLLVVWGLLAIGTAEAQADPCDGTGCRASLRPSPEQPREWTSPVLFTGGVTLSIHVYAGKTEIPLINVKHEYVAIFTGEGVRVKATFCGRGRSGYTSPTERTRVLGCITARVGVQGTGDF